MKRALFFSIMLVLVGGNLAGAEFSTIPDPDETTATMPAAPDLPLVLFVLPDGTGSPFSQAQVRGEGIPADAHIEMIVRDAFAHPVPDYPAEDLWLQSDGGGLISCNGGTCADFDTDENGFTIWESPLHAGGASTGSLRCFRAGIPLFGPPFDMSIVSADLNGDLHVNLVDVGQFSGIYFEGYAFEADFYSDGVLNLVDVGRLAQGMGGSCP